MHIADRRRIGRTGLEVTLLGFGGAPLGNLYAPVAEADARGALDAAWDAGCRVFDTAPLYGYGLSERRFGEALRVRPRGEFVLSTKVGRRLKAYREPPTDDDKFVDAGPFEPVYDYSYDGALRSIEDSLQRLGTHRVDIALVHDVDRFTHGDGQRAMFDAAMKGACRALDDLRRDGTIRAFGLGVNEAEVCRAALDECEPDVFLLAGRYTLLEQAPLDDLLPACERRGVSILLGGPYNSGILVTGPRPGATYNYDPASAEVAERVGRIQKVCAAHGVALPAAALQFPLGHASVATVVPGGRTADEVGQNAAWLETPLPAALWADLKSEGLVREDSPTPA